MPTGHYGDVKIAGKKYHVCFWSSLKSDCQREARDRREDGFLARIVKHPIKMGTLAGGATAEQWAVAIRGKTIHRYSTHKGWGKSVAREDRGKRHGRK